MNNFLDISFYFLSFVPVLYGGIRHNIYHGPKKYYQMINLKAALQSERVERRKNSNFVSDFPDWKPYCKNIPLSSNIIL